MSARLRAGSEEGKTVACMSLSFIALFGVYRRPCVLCDRLAFREKGMAWEIMGRNGFFWEKLRRYCDKRSS